MILRTFQEFLHKMKKQWLVLIISFCACVIPVTSAPVQIIRSWQGAFQGQITIHADHDTHEWTVNVVFDRPIDGIDMWQAMVVSHTDTEYVIRNLPWDADIKAGDDLNVTFQVRYTGVMPSASFSVQGESSQNQHNGLMNHTRPQDVLENHGDSSKKYNYSESLRLSILFYAAQRSGKLPSNNPIAWRGDSALQDSDNGHDLTGGWYDAGDHVKYTFPMAYSTWVLSWGMLAFHTGYTAAGQTDNACDMIRFPLEYFLKCWIPNENKLYVQVGTSNIDHAYWGRPELMNMSRPAYAVTPSCRGSDVAADTVSAFTTGYLVFKVLCHDTIFADKLLNAAKSLYNFAKNNRGVYTNCVKSAEGSYTSTDDKDELSAAAAWMYTATGDNNYLQDAQTWYLPGTPWAFSWDAKNSGAAILLYGHTHDNRYKTDIENFIREFMPGGGVHYTACGLAWRSEWGSNRYAANAALIALMAAAKGIQPDRYKSWARSQINYLLGDNKLGVSYEIGFGETYPLHPHHRGSSCPTNVDWCIQNAPGPNPNVLYGGLVGGPDQNDNYDDGRDDNVKNDVSCSYNAGFQSALAGLLYFADSNTLPAAPAPKC